MQTYYAVGVIPGANVLQNGDFESGDVGFLRGANSSDTYFHPVSNQGAGSNNGYTVSNETQVGNGSWVALTPTNGSLMYVADSKGGIGEKVLAWEFTAGTGDKFLFSGTVANNHEKVVPDPGFTVDPVHLGVYIDDVLIADMQTAKDFNWLTVTASWTATSPGTHTLDIRDLLGENGPGNDLP